MYFGFQPKHSRDKITIQKLKLFYRNKVNYNTFIKKIKGTRGALFKVENYIEPTAPLVRQDTTPDPEQ